MAVIRAGTETNPNHQELVRSAAHWLRNTQRCYFVSAEHTTILPETPDAIGWAHDGSILIECKTSVSDFRRDKDKWHRRFDGVGESRWFLAPKNVIPKTELYDGWGLLEYSTCVSGTTVLRKVVEPTKRTSTIETLLNERRMLMSAAHRLGEAVSLVKPFSICVDGIQS